MNQLISMTKSFDIQTNVKVTTSIRFHTGCTIVSFRIMPTKQSSKKVTEVLVPRICAAYERL